MDVKWLFWLQNRKLKQKLTKLSQQVWSVGQRPDISMTNDVEATVLAPVSDLSQGTETGPLMPSTGGKQSLSIEEMDGEQHQEMSLQEREKLGLHEDTVHLQDRLQQMIAENEALRKGMHEILDSIHNQDGKRLAKYNSFNIHLKEAVHLKVDCYCENRTCNGLCTVSPFVIFRILTLCGQVRGYHHSGGCTASVFRVDLQDG
jgi:hypothetical protein